MNVDEITDMLIAMISNDPIERVEGLHAAAQFLHDLQQPTLRYYVDPRNADIHAGLQSIGLHPEVEKTLQYLGSDGKWHEVEA